MRIPESTKCPICSVWLFITYTVLIQLIHIHCTFLFFSSSYQTLLGRSNTLNIYLIIDYRIGQKAASAYLFLKGVLLRSRKKTYGWDNELNIYRHQFSGIVLNKVTTCRYISQIYFNFIHVELIVSGILKAQGRSYVLFS